MITIPTRFETERLIIRAPQPGDSVSTHASVEESFPELHEWMPWARQRQTLAETETYARESALRYRNREELAMLLFRKSDGVHVGNSGLHSIAWDVPRMEIGYWIRTSLSGQGYMTEAVTGICAFAFSILGVLRLEIRCDARNRRSAAVAERVGFTLESRMRWQSRDPQGGLRDTLVYVLFSDDQPETVQRAAKHLNPSSP